MDNYNRHPRTFILSGERACYSEDVNRARSINLLDELETLGVPFAQAQGSFEGVKEVSFVITGRANEDTVLALAITFQQDSYLVIAENDRTAYLVHVNSEDYARGYHQHLGRFRCWGDKEPNDGRGWTYLDGFYYDIVPTSGPDLPGGF